MAEQTSRIVLGALLLSPALLESTDELASSLFTGREQKTFEAIADIWHESRPDKVDLVNLANRIGGDDTFSYLSDLLDGAAIYAIQPDGLKNQITELVKSKIAKEVARKIYDQAKYGEIDMDEIRPLLQRFDCAGDKDRRLAESVRSWINNTIGEFDVKDVYSELGVQSIAGKANVRQTIGRMVQEGLLKPALHREGRYRVPTKLSQPIDLVGTTATPLDIYLPLGINDLINIYPKSVIVCAGEGQQGKGHPYGTPILTPSGWRPIECLSVGDTVYSQDGTETTITGVFERGIQQCFRFYFNDGSSIACDLEHQWDVMFDYNRWCAKTGRGAANKKLKKWATLPTYVILGRCGIGDVKDSRAFVIPRTKPIKFKPTKTTMDPYLLGVFLGDGCLRRSTPSITTADQEIVDYVSKFYKLTKSPSSKYDYRVLGSKHDLERLGVYGAYSWEKHIPKEYLWGDVDTRLGVLRGLMDTDGDISKRGNSAHYTTTSKSLADGVAFIVGSLGGRAIIREKIKTFTHRGVKKIGRKCYLISIILDFCPFSLERKARFYSEPSKRYYKKIVTILNAGIQETICLSVDHPSGLYVANDFIVTHNTALALDVVKNNMAKHDVKYFFSEGGPEELRSRLERHQDIGVCDWTMDAYEHNGNPADVIDPDAFNVYDYLYVPEPFYVINDILQEVHKKLNRGMAWVNIQKNRNKELGDGGDFSLRIPRLYMTLMSDQLVSAPAPDLQYVVAKIIKAKGWKQKLNPDGRIMPFSISEGWEIRQRCSSWEFAASHEVVRKKKIF